MRRSSKLLIFLLLLIQSTAFACESYEDCMETSKSVDWQEMSITEASVLRNSYYLTAIAFKLDEISKKLDRNNFEPSKGTRWDEYAHTEPCMKFDKTWKILSVEGKNYRIGKEGCYSGLVTKEEWENFK